MEKISLSHRLYRKLLITPELKQALCKDLSYLKSLKLKDIADKTGLHISTVGRIASNKYITTPQGTLRIKDLFSPKISLDRGARYRKKYSFSNKKYHL